MRLIYSVSAAILLGVLVLAACNSNDNSGNKAGGNSTARVPSSTPGHIAPADGVKRITTVELRNALEKGQALVIDVRGDAAYKQNHIKGSISIPLGDIETRLNELPRDKMIVTYCS